MIKTDMRNKKKTHLGENLRHIREGFGLKQDALASKIGKGWSQKKISLLEKEEHIDDETLKELADALEIEVDNIKDYEHQRVLNYIQHNHGGANAANGHINQHVETNSPVYEPIHKVVEAYEKNKLLYEELLKTEREKIALMEKLLESYKK
jgi:transcriptional regulator with XRE-family HTH domain